jgi:hypothetical protein
MFNSRMWYIVRHYFSNGTTQWSWLGLTIFFKGGDVIVRTCSTSRRTMNQRGESSTTPSRCTQGCENLIHPVMGDESLGRVVTNAISLYSRDVRTLTSCCRLISLSSAEGTIVAFALVWMRMGGLAGEMYGGWPGGSGDRRKRIPLPSPTFYFANSGLWWRVLPDLLERQLGFVVEEREGRSGSEKWKEFFIGPERVYNLFE